MKDKNKMKQELHVSFSTKNLAMTLSLWAFVIGFIWTLVAVLHIDVIVAFLGALVFALLIGLLAGLTVLFIVKIVID